MTPLIQITVPEIDRRYKGSIVPSVRRTVVDKERMRPGQWLGSVLWHCWLGDKKDI